MVIQPNEILKARIHHGGELVIEQFGNRVIEILRFWQLWSFRGECFFGRGLLLWSLTAEA
jgi:hypothetical protein